MAKAQQIDNIEIEALFDQCQQIVLGWNEQRGEDNGKLEISLELKTQNSTQKIIRLDADPPGTGRAGRMTVLQLEYDPDTKKYMGHTPGLPINNRQEVTLEALQSTISHFNP